MNIQDYRAMRAKGMSAKSAYVHVRDGRDSHSDLEWNDGQATWQQDGYEIRAEMRFDEYADLTYLGEFSNDWKPGAVRHEYLDSRTFPWFIPMVTEDEHFKELRKSKYGRTTARELARSYVQFDYDRLRHCGDDWSPVDIIVTVSRAGIELGSAACGGIESDESHIAEIALDLANKAMDEAKDALGALCAASSTGSGNYNSRVTH